MCLIMDVRWFPQRGFIHHSPFPSLPTPPPSIRTRGLVTVTWRIGWLIACVACLCFLWPRQTEDKIEGQAQSSKNNVISRPFIFHFDRKVTPLQYVTLKLSTPFTNICTFIRTVTWANHCKSSQLNSPITTLISVTIVTNSGQRFCKIDEVYLWWLFSKKLNSHFRGRPILLITRMITDRIGLTIINDRILTTLNTRHLIQMNICNIIYLNCRER